jgi:TonB family protein
LNQEKTELAQENDFIAPQPVVPFGTRNFQPYPNAAFAGRVDGAVVLKLTMDATGKQKTVSIESETPPGYEFGKTALEVFNGILSFRLSETVNV